MKSKQKLCQIPLVARRTHSAICQVLRKVKNNGGHLKRTFFFFFLIFQHFIIIFSYLINLTPFIAIPHFTVLYFSELYRYMFCFVLFCFFLVNFLFSWSIHKCEWGIKVSHYYCVGSNFNVVQLIILYLWL